MRPGPATRAASFVDLSSCLLAARNSEPMLLVRQRPPGVPHLPVSTAERDSENHCSAASAMATGPTRSKSGGGGRNARATGTRSRAFPNVPWQLTLENCQFATGVTAIIIQQD